ncbi:hypothetical protein Tco_0838793 [Tanacetum coccineum]|uniref:Uncharacterized protein n=1 Tax=Tanacetum coccineum TaxID=301880 RepID=A0ABQ5APV6_9ASTR
MEFSGPTNGIESSPSTLDGHHPATHRDNQSTYDNAPNMFSIRIHHGGKFQRNQDVGSIPGTHFSMVSTQEPYCVKSVEDVVIEDYVSSREDGEDVEQGNGQEDESAPTDGQFFYDDEGIYTAYETEYELTRGNDEERNYRKYKKGVQKRRRTESTLFHESIRNVKLNTECSVRIRARCEGKVPVFTMSPRANPDIPVKVVQDQLQRELEVIDIYEQSFSKLKLKLKERLEEITIKIWDLEAAKDLLGLDDAHDEPFPASIGSKDETGYKQMEFTHWPMHWLKLKVRVHGAGSCSGWCGQANKDLLWRAASCSNVRDFEKCRAKIFDLLPTTSVEVLLTGKMRFGGKRQAVITLLEIWELTRDYWNMALMTGGGQPTPEKLSTLEKIHNVPLPFAPKHHVPWIGPTKEEKKEVQTRMNQFVKEVHIEERKNHYMAIMRKHWTHDKGNMKGQASSYKQAQKTEPAVGQDGSGGSGVGAIIGLSFAAGEGGAGGAGVASQGSSHTRWTKRRVQTEIISPQKRTPTQPASQPSTSSQVPVSETRNADGREMGDGVPTQSSAAGGASEWSFL